MTEHHGRRSSPRSKGRVRHRRDHESFGDHQSRVWTARCGWHRQRHTRIKTGDTIPSTAQAEWSPYMTAGTWRAFPRRDPSGDSEHFPGGDPSGDSDHSFGRDSSGTAITPSEGTLWGQRSLLRKGLLWGQRSLPRRYPLGRWCVIVISTERTFSWRQFGRAVGPLAGGLYGRLPIASRR